MKNQRFHLSDAAVSRNCDGLVTKALAAGKITERDADLIREFIGEQTGKISPTREYKIIDTLILNREFFPQYADCKTGDVQVGVRKILNATKPNGEPRYKANTKTDRVKQAKQFFLWMCDNGYGTLNDRKIQKITPPRPDRMTKTAADILTEDEIHRMKKAARSSRDRAIVSVLYEGGLRASELGSLTWGDLRFTPWSVILNTDGKTGAPRYVPLVESRSYLAQWRNDYPGDPTEPNAFVFLTFRNRKPLTYSTLSYQLQDIAREAGIDKKFTCHIFRHSRITHLIQQGVPETHIKKMMWGNLTTDMFQTYAHITNRDIDDCMAVLHGISRPELDEEQQRRKKVLEPRQCSECGTVNGSTLNYCGTCGASLTEEARNTATRARDELQRMLAEDPSGLLEALQLTQDIRAAKTTARNEGGAEI